MASKKKEVKVRDLKPSKDAKGGVARSSNNASRQSQNASRGSDRASKNLMDRRP